MTAKRNKKKERYCCDLLIIIVRNRRDDIFFTGSAPQASNAPCTMHLCRRTKFQNINSENDEIPPTFNLFNSSVRT